MLQSSELGWVSSGRTPIAVTEFSGRLSSTTGSECAACRYLKEPAGVRNKLQGVSMMTLKTRLAALILSALCSLTAAHAQLTPSGDAYTNTGSSSTNYGSNVLLDVVSGTQTSYIQFNLSSIPSGYTSTNVAKATLKLYVNAVGTAGSFNVVYVSGAWSESTITARSSPALGSTIVSA